MKLTTKMLDDCTVEVKDRETGKTIIYTRGQMGQFMTSEQFFRRAAMNKARTEPSHVWG